MNQTSHIRFEEIIANQCTVQHLKCIQLSNYTNNKPITICSYNKDATQALVVACPDGGVSFNIGKGWLQQSHTTNVRTRHERHDATQSFSVVSKDIDFTSATFSLVSDKIKLQSSVHPLDIHSFANQKYGLNLKCPKGGILLQSGTGGITHTTSGNIEYQVEQENAQVKIATRGSKKNCILLGNTNTETIIENQLTVRGKLVLSDDSVVEKHVSVVHELQNIVELACQNSHSSSTYDFGLVAKQSGKKSGMVFDHTRDLFYFSTELGNYQQNRFTLPKHYADLQAKTFIAQQKLMSPYVESHCVQCRTIRCGRDNTLVLQSPVVQCSERLLCASLQTELNKSVHISSTSVHTETLSVQRQLTTQQLQTQHVTIGDTFQAHNWFFNTVGPHGTHRTLQDFLDSADDVRNTTSTLVPRTLTTQHVIMQTTNHTHNCNAILNCPKCVIDAQYSVLTGVMEITEECEEIVLLNARLSQFTLTSSTEYKREVSRPITITIRNASGTVKDWCFDMPNATLQFEFCNLLFQNKILGNIRRMMNVFSVLEGDAMDMLEIHTSS